MRLVLATENFFDLRMGPFIASFLFMSAIAHFTVSAFRIQMVLEESCKGINYAEMV